jgi:hypothetical protein
MTTLNEPAGIINMKIDTNDKPRNFFVGRDIVTTISHEADIYLQPNEQVTFITENGAEFDFVRKDWGYYATPSMNKRLKEFGFVTALVQNEAGNVYIFAVESVRMESFEKYCREHKQTVIMWLDKIVCKPVDR